LASAPDLSYAIIRVARAHRQLAGELLGALGVHPGQEMVLTMLWSRDGRTATELAGGACVEPGTMSRTLASLERAGLLTRETSTSDRRAVTVTLTTKGRDLQPKVEAAWRELSRRTCAGLSAADRTQLMTLLGRVSDNLARAR
jgi:DNA-binding MarR family transcriptional regulator